MKLPWNEAPEWAQWAAMDAIELWYWFEHEPEIAIGDSFWSTGRGDIQRFEFPPCAEWQTSKQRKGE